MNTLRQIRVVLYRLKRSIGLPVTITAPTTNVHDVETGVINRTYTSIDLSRVIVMSNTEWRDHKYLSMGQFAYGGHFDASKKVMVLDKGDLPSTYTPNLKDSCTFNSMKWEFEEIVSTADNRGYLIKLKRVSPA